MVSLTFVHNTFIILTWTPRFRLQCREAPTAPHHPGHHRVCVLRLCLHPRGLHAHLPRQLHRGGHQKPRAGHVLHWRKDNDCFRDRSGRDEGKASSRHLSLQPIVTRIIYTLQNKISRSEKRRIISNLGLNLDIRNLSIFYISAYLTTWRFANQHQSIKSLIKR